MPDTWSPDSWKSRPLAQPVAYADPEALRTVLDQLSKLPPLVTSWEVERLKGQLAEAAAGDRFLLQGGDCSETFDDCSPDIIAAKLKILLQMSIVLVHGSRRGVIRVGRFAGQYAKPRSQQTETRDGVDLPSFRGYLINRPGFTSRNRTPDPQLLLRSYERAALTLNFIRGLVEGGFADLHHPEQWELGFVDCAQRGHEYRRIMEAIVDSVRFAETVAGRTLSELTRVEFFSSHEGLHLDYERAQTRKVPRRTGWYDLTTHMPWIGDRTRDIDGAHVEFFRGVNNPIGVKVGPTMTPEQLQTLVDRLDPKNEPGRLTLIHRLGARQIERCLPSLVEAVRQAGRTVLWCCDPMHGNTVTTAEGVKTRSFDDILSELNQAFDIHDRLGSRLGGVHFELTGEDVTECVGGARGLAESDLSRAYRSDVDPRLNYEQAMEMAFLIARRMRRDG
jgi:3-deoxy-7-phosphoheptulonate synthase